jgi:hypothetical protein
MSMHGNIGIDEHDEWRARIMRALAELRSDELAQASRTDTAQSAPDEDEDG